MLGDAHLIAQSDTALLEASPLHCAGVLVYGDGVAGSCGARLWSAGVVRCCGALL